MKPVFFIAAAFVAGGCSSPPRTAPPPRDATKEAWYAQTVEQLAAMNKDAARDFKNGKSDEAAAIIQNGEAMAAHLLAVPRPTLAAMEAASDLDELYGQMLFSNRNYGWARLLFQKNVARWKHWTPPTPDSIRRLNDAQAEIADCDKHIEAGLPN